MLILQETDLILFKIGRDFSTDLKIWPAEREGAPYLQLQILLDLKKYNPHTS
ncbi:unnamed protein product, partial [Vitis vinifera]